MTYRSLALTLALTLTGIDIITGIDINRQLTDIGIMTDTLFIPIRTFQKSIWYFQNHQTHYSHPHTHV